MKLKYIMLFMALSFFMTLDIKAIDVVNNVIDCGQVMYRLPAEAEFEIKNTEEQFLRIVEIRTSCGCVTVDYPKGEIERGQTAKIKAVYDAAQMGHFDKSIAVYTTSGVKPVMLRIKGVVVEEVIDYKGSYPYRISGVSLDTRDIEFDNVERGDRPSYNIHLLNSTNSVVEPVIMHLPAYLTADVSPSKIQPGRGGVVRLTLDSHKLRDYGLTQAGVYLGTFIGDKVSADKEINVSAVLLPDFNSLTIAQRQNAPSLSMVTDTLVLGTVGGRRRTKAELDISNIGKSELDITALQMFGTGLKLSLNKTKIEVGEIAKLKVSLDTRALKRSKTMPRVLIITNDPEHSKVVVYVDVRR